MKKYCKHIDITDRKLIRSAIKDCLSGKKRRGDTEKLLEEYDLDGLVELVRNEILEEKLDLKPIHYAERVDDSSGKLRRIGIQHIKQLLFDFVALYGLKPLFRRIGEFQCASLPGRGQSYGVRHMRKWLRNPAIKYAIKLDIRKCYESTDREKLMKFLHRHVRNPKLLWLVRELIYTFESGLSIGSALSQYLCNVYLGELYHYAAERIFKTRRGKRINLIRHVLFQMDDIVILGSSAKDLKKAARLMIQKAEEMGYKIKPGWEVLSVSGHNFVDVMGYRFYRDKTTIRRRVWLRIRKAFRKAWRMRRSMPIFLARRVVAYYGRILCTDCWKIRKKLKIEQCKLIATGVISNYDRQISRGAAAGECG